MIQIRPKYQYFIDNMELVQKYTDEGYILSMLFNYETEISKVSGQQQGIIPTPYFHTTYLQVIIKSLLIGDYKYDYINDVVKEEDKCITPISRDGVYVICRIKTVAPMCDISARENITDYGLAVEVKDISFGGTLFAPPVCTNYRTLAEKIVRSNKRVIDVIRGIGKRETQEETFMEYFGENKLYFIEKKHNEIDHFKDILKAYASQEDFKNLTQSTLRDYFSKIYTSDRTKKTADITDLSDFNSWIAHTVDQERRLLMTSESEEINIRARRNNRDVQTFAYATYRRSIAQTDMTAGQVIPTNTDSRIGRIESIDNYAPLNIDWGEEEDEEGDWVDVTDPQA
jgi:hypothetical protein